MKHDQINIMVDLETVGVRPSSGILSVGAVPFNLDGIIFDPFYRKIDVSDSQMLGFTTDESTMQWWNGQNDATREEAFSGTEGVREVILAFGDYIKKYGTIFLWGNGADFDNVLLTYHFNALGISQPWMFYNNRCFRTLKSLYPMIHYEKPVIAHNALEDAKAQAIHAVKILNRIKTGIDRNATPN